MSMEDYDRYEAKRDTWDELIEFNDTFFPDWREGHPVFLSNALAGEVGEVCNLTKKLAGGGTSDTKGINLVAEARKECADVFIYLALLVERLGLTESEFMLMVREKNEENRRRMLARRNKSPEYIHIQWSCGRTMCGLDSKTEWTCAVDAKNATCPKCREANNGCVKFLDDEAKKSEGK